MTAKLNTRPSILARISRERLIGIAVTGLNLALIAGIAYIAARFVWLIAFGASAQEFAMGPDRAGNTASGSSYVADLGALRESDMFADRRQAPEVRQRTVEVLPETELNLQLRGIRRGADERSGGVIIQPPSGQQAFFAPGDEIVDGVELLEIYADHVVISRRGIEEALYLRESGAAAAAAASRSSIPAPTSVLPRPPAGGAVNGVPPGSQAFEVAGLFEVEPYQRNGALIGYRLTDNNSAVLGAIGLREGDVIVEINGVALNSIDDVAGMIDNLRDEDRWSLSIVRNGLPLNMQVELP